MEFTLTTTAIWCIVHAGKMEFTLTTAAIWCIVHAGKLEFTLTTAAIDTSRKLKTSKNTHEYFGKE